MAILLPVTNVGMTRFHKHFFIYLSILARAYSYIIELNGDLSFEIRISDALAPIARAVDDENYYKKNYEDNLKAHPLGSFEVKTTEREEEIEDMERIIHEGRLTGVTVAPMVECVYQYPDSEQFNAMLSNMMNELTKVFVGLHKLMRRNNGRRHGKTRYKVVDKKDTRFFERIYTNMTREYSQFYNSTAGRVARAAEDPCENQDELKDVWRELLERSLSGLRRAALGCIEEFYRSNSGSEVQGTRSSLEQYLERNLRKVRSRQLHMLCDSFQLCYDDLL